MKLSPKQKQIIAEIQKTGQITLTRAVELCGENLYHNASKHVGVTLSGMVKRGLIERVRPGVFRAMPVNDSLDL